MLDFKFGSMHLVDDFNYKTVGVFISHVLTSEKKKKMLRESSVVPVSLWLVRSCSCSSAQLFPADRDVLVLDALHSQARLASS